MKKPVVGIIMGSDSDMPIMEEALRVLNEFKVANEVKVLSAHRTPKETSDYARSALARGVKVIIAGAGGAAHLAGVLASHTTLPVIGVPIETRSLAGIDSLFSIVQMPSGVPVATMAIGKAGAENAAILAVEILALEDKGLGLRLKGFKRRMAASVRKKALGLLKRLEKGEV